LFPLTRPVTESARPAPADAALNEIPELIDRPIERLIDHLGAQARAASRPLAMAPRAAKDAALLACAAQIGRRQGEILDANREDVLQARARGLDPALIDRLELNPKRLAAMVDGLHQVAALPDPVGAIDEVRVRPTGISVGKMRVPLGVVAMIYESRPNVTIDAGSLCLKAGNAVILRGGSEARLSNQVLGECLRAGLAEADLPADAVQVVPTTDRAAVDALCGAAGLIDLLIPRGGKGLIERVSAAARVPVLKHLDGNCHVYLDDTADPGMALDIAVNAKTHRYGVCNAMETLLVSAAAAERLLPAIAEALHHRGVELRGCDQALPLLGAGAVPADEADWYAEYLAPILAVKVVQGVEAAIAHINHYGSHHTDAIVTRDHAHAMRFLREVDSASVMVNASTRFADGFEYGLGAEIGISTDKFHARGPVGLEGLTSQKWIVLGQGEVRV